ncbi:MAG: NAD(P)H:quinone oxidoreductase [Candidatus Adiutrix sp.]
MKILILFYSVYGHIFELAQSVEKGVTEAGLEAVLRKAPETLSDEVIKTLGGEEPRKKWAHVPTVTVQDMIDCDGLIIGTPTRFGGMCGQVRQFLDSTGKLFAQGSMLGKAGAFFTSSNSQHGGQETAILSSIPYLLHMGMVYVGLPYAVFPAMGNTEEVMGGSPYGASTIAASDGSRRPSALDLEGARTLGHHVAQITAKLRRD